VVGFEREGGGRVVGLVGWIRVLRCGNIVEIICGRVEWSSETGGNEDDLGLDSSGRGR